MKRPLPQQLQERHDALPGSGLETSTIPSGVPSWFVAARMSEVAIDRCRTSEKGVRKS
jgi:hypothetical protein